MSSLHNFINVRNLTLEQQRVYIMYVNQYELISNQIDTLYEMLSDIRANITDLQTNSRRNRFDIRTIISDSHINRDMINRDIINRDIINRDGNINNDIQNRNNFTNTENTTTTSTTNITQNISPIERFLTNFFNTPIHSLHIPVSSVQINDNNLIHLTSEQINNASRLVRYNEIENPTCDRCSISLLEFNNDDNVRQILYCGHIFHENSLQEWFRRNTVCPLCRYDILNNNIPSSLQENNSSNSFSNDINSSLSTLVETNIDVNNPQFISVLNEVTQMIMNRYSNRNENTNVNTNENTNENTVSDSGSYTESDTGSDIDDISIS